jgi:hypothetical protein
MWKRVRRISTLHPHFSPGADLVPFPVTIIQKRSACRLYQESHNLPTDRHPSYIMDALDASVLSFEQQPLDTLRIELEKEPAFVESSMSKDDHTLTCVPPFT